MSSTRLHSIGAYVVSAALLLILFFSVRNSLPDSYSSDDSYVRNAMAESVATYGMYGIDGAPKPAVHDVWWRWIGGKLMVVWGAKASGLFPVLSILFSLALLYILIKVLTLQYPQHTIVGWIAGLLLVLSPPLLLWSVNGMSGPVAALLILLAVIIHMSSACDGRPLPVSAAVCIALAATLRLEYISIWLALFVHAILLSITNRKKVSFVAALVNGFNGVLLILIFLAPLINWNMRVIEVPWPRSFDAAMALDALAGGDTAGSASVLAIIDAAIRASSAAWHTSGFSGTFVVKLFSGFGLFYWIARSRGGSQDNYFTLLLVLLLTPVFHAFLVPFIGWSGAVPLYEALLPIWILAVIAGIAALQHVLDPLLSKLLPVFGSHTRHMIVFGMFAVAPILSGVVSNSEILREDKLTAEDTSDAMNEALNQIERVGSSSTPIISDFPGILLSQWNGPVFDLNAELNPELLYYMNGTRNEDLDQIVAHVKEQGHGSVALVIWNQSYWISDDFAACENLNADATLPFVCIR